MEFQRQALIAQAKCLLDLEHQAHRVFLSMEIPNKVFIEETILTSEYL